MKFSIQNKEWKIKDFDKNLVEKISNDFNLDYISSKLLAIRGIPLDQIKFFLDPKIKYFLPNPSSFLDLDKASELLINMIIENKKIYIFGDYDVDGAASSSMLSQYLSKFKVKHDIYIPDRIRDGYGPSVESFKKIIEGGVDLIITLDCGTTSFEAIEYAKKNNVKVIIIDHHKSSETLPIADAIINPNRLDEKDDFYYLCAAGVLFIFLVSLNSKLRKIKYFNDHNQEPDLFNFLDLVMLATVCDVVPLINLNRSFVHQGLKIISNRNNLGIKTLVDYSKINKKISTYEVGYVLGPKINAGGRIGKSNLGVRLLNSKDAEEAYLISTELHNLNLKRKDIEKKAVEEAIDLAEKDSNLPAIIVSSKNWHEGVIGIVASRLKDHFGKPSFVISVNGNLGKGSARSVHGFDIGMLLIKCSQLGIILKGGGHPMAGGFTIDLKNTDQFKQEIFSQINKKNKIDISNEILLDSYIDVQAVNEDFLNKISILEPFGSGNREPTFAIENMEISKVLSTDSNHIKAIFKSGNKYLNTICFNSKNKVLGQYLLNAKNKKYNLAGKIQLNEWNNKRDIEFVIEDIQLIN